MSTPFVLSENLFDASLLFILLAVTVPSMYTSSYKRYRHCSQIYVVFFSIMILLFAVFGNLDLDYHSYESTLDYFFRNGHKSKLFEPVYYLIAYIAGNYTCWRLIVWGMATLLMMSTISRLGLSYKSTYFFILVFYALSFYKLRNSLGFSIIFWGVSFLLVPNKRVKTLSYVWGLCMIVCSYWFHSSMMVTMAVLVMAVIVPFNRKTIIFSIVLLPFLVTATTIVINTFLHTEFSTTDVQLASTIHKSVRYVSGEARSDYSIFGVINMVITYVPMYLSLFIITRDTVFRGHKLPRNVYLLFKFWFIMTYIASLFFVQDVASWIYIRFMTMGYFPMALVLGYYFYNRRYTVMMWCILFVSTISVLYSLYYPFYKRFMSV